MQALPRIAVVLAAACMSVAAAAQVTVISGQAVDQYGAPLPFAQVRVCNAATSSGTPCTPTATIYTNYSLSGTPASNPYSADQYGNYTLYAGPLASPNLYVVQLSPASGITWSYVTAGQTCGPSGCTAGLFNATISPYFEINGVQITSGAMSDHANIAYLNVANVFTASPQTAPVFNATTQFNVAGTQIASTNLSDSANLAKLNAANTFTATNTFTTVNATAYQVGGVALAASNLSNGVSGTGAVCLASGSACTTSAITSFAAPSGSWPTWLVPTVTNPTTAPSLAVAASAIPNSALANASITINSTPCTLGASCTPAGTVLASTTFSSCTVASDGGSVWDCSGSASWGTTLSGTTYKVVCTMGQGSYTLNELGGGAIYVESKTTTGITYGLAFDHSGANGFTSSIDCIATN